MKDYLHLRILGVAPVSSEGEGSPIIWPISETNDKTKMTYNNNLDNDIISLPFPASVMGTNTLRANGLPVDLKRFSASRNFS